MKKTKLNHDKLKELFANKWRKVKIKKCEFEYFLLLIYVRHKVCTKAYTVNL